jgi:carboxyl-terminal processing protease
MDFRNPRMRLTSILLLLLATVPAFFQQAVAQQTVEEAEDQGPEVAASDDPDAAEAESQVPLAEIRRYVAVYNTVKQAYVEPVDDRKLMQSAIRGLLLDLDPHSVYLEKADADEFDEQAEGSYAGIGVEVQTQPDNTLRIVAPIADTPAARAGLKSGDVIVAVDGKPLAGDDSMSPLKGEPGTKVKLTVLREGTDKPFDVELVREEIRITSVESRLLEPGYGYVQIKVFQADTGAEFEKHLDQLQAKGKLRGLVLDLRSNPGGLLTAAVQVADDLLDKGAIVSTRGRIVTGDAKFEATPGDRLNGAPMVVLVDAGSASASEVLAAALRDHGRARIVGSRTFGKGSVQTVLPLDNGDSIKLTTARYYTPDGKSIQASGLQPDVAFANGGKPTPADYSEAALPGHLQGDEEAAEGYSAGEVLDGDEYIAKALAELKAPGSTVAKKAVPVATKKK